MTQLLICKILHILCYIAYYIFILTITSIPNKLCINILIYSFLLHVTINIMLMKYNITKIDSIKINFS